MNQRTGHGGRIDKNQPAIVKELRGLGYSVESTASLGDGFPDIIVGAAGRNFLFEIKESEAAKLTPPEETFARDWCGQLHRIETSEQAIKIITKRARQ